MRSYRPIYLPTFSVELVGDGVVSPAALLISKEAHYIFRRNVRDSGSHFPSPSDRNPFVGGAEDKKGEYGPSCKPTENTYR